MNSRQPANETRHTVHTSCKQGNCLTSLYYPCLHGAAIEIPPNVLQASVPERAINPARSRLFNGTFECLLCFQRSDKSANSVFMRCKGFLVDLTKEEIKRVADTESSSLL